MKSASRNLPGYVTKEIVSKRSEGSHHWARTNQCASGVAWGVGIIGMLARKRAATELITGIARRVHGAAF